MTNGQYCDRSGKIVPLGAEIGRGGEGSVHEIIGRPDAVAKVYHRAIDSEKAVKISSMISLKNEQLLRATAWPIDSLHLLNGKMIGLIMPKVEGYKDIHMLYGPKTRLTEFPNANFAFILHAANNLARAFVTVHQYGQVIGDVNHSNIVVSPLDATVKLIDCDSFQIAAKQDLFLCDVGVLTHQPPEFQNMSSFRGITRNANHDNFGLAVLIFQLLFMGRHPFSGRYSGSGDMPIEKAIKEFRFAYSSSAASKQMQPPPNTLPLNSLPTDVSILFEKAYSPEGKENNCRPTAHDWITALEKFSGSLTKCSNQDNHLYYRVLKDCPWCALENRTGVILFQTVISFKSPNSTFVLEAVWKQIKAISSPSVARPLLVLNSVQAQPSEKSKKYRKSRRIRKALSPLPLIIAVGIVMIIPNASIAIIFSVIVSIVIFNSSNKTLKKELKDALKDAEQAWQFICNRWEKEALASEFDTKYNEMENARKEYLELAALRDQKLKKLESDIKKRQLERHLQFFRIDQASISGIGPGRKMTLQSFGIETAAEINAYAIRQVPGFGPAFTKNLLDWRHSVEQKFVFDPKKGVPQADILALDKDIASKRAKLESLLLSGPSQLLQISNQIKLQRNTLWNEVERRAMQLKQAQVDIK